MIFQRDKGDLTLHPRKEGQVSTSILEENSVLKEMFESGHSYTSAGLRVRMHSNIRIIFAEALYKTILQYRPDTVVEVGMAFGVSTLAILTALNKLGKGHLISIDPSQSTGWKGCGVEAVRRSGLDSYHQLIEKTNYVALPQLLVQGQRIDFGYIDGWHTFDYALFDFWYIDKMLNVGGVVGFNDCIRPSIRKVIAFLRSHRKYEEIDVGLHKKYIGYSRKNEFLRIIRGARKSSYYKRGEDQYFRKIENWEPKWNFFAEF